MMTALPTSDIEDLKEFVRHIHTLTQTRFAKAVFSRESITLKRIGTSQTGEIVNFDEEDCRSFLLGCRLLLQKKDRVSITHVWTIFKDRINDDSWFVRINPPRWMLDEFLEQKTMFATPNGDPISNRLFLDTFLYGSYAHLDRSHRERFSQWEAHQQFPFMKLLFLTILQALYKCSVDMSSVVSEWLEQNRCVDSGAGEVKL